MKTKGGPAASVVGNKLLAFLFPRLHQYCSNLSQGVGGGEGCEREQLLQEAERRRHWVLGCSAHPRVGSLAPARR